MLATNNLFVDYFNAFLLNPELGGDKLRFNYVTGDLEIIQPDRISNEQRDISSLSSSSSTKLQVRFDESGKQRGIFSSTAESVKLRVETQLKAIIKSTSSSNLQHGGEAITANSYKSTISRPPKPSSAKLNTELLFEQIRK